MKYLKGRFRKGLAALLAALLVAATLPTGPLTASAAGTQTALDVGKGNIVIGDGTVDGFESDGKEIKTANASGYVITGATAQYTVDVTGGAQSITLSDAGITPADGCAFTIEPGASVSLTLEGSNTLDSSKNSVGQSAGLSVSAGAAVAISGTGSLAATGDNGGAGIGGGNKTAGGAINISGGTVTASGGPNGGAGIGGGCSGAGGTVSISGGVVTASGGDSGAGIGGGYAGKGGTTAITGGTVTAKSVNGAGIGGGYNGMGGYYGTCGASTITGGSVKATSVQGGVTDGLGRSEYCVTVATAFGANASVSGLVDGWPASQMQTDGDGKLYFWMTSTGCAMVEYHSVYYSACVAGISDKATAAMSAMPELDLSGGSITIDDGKITQANSQSSYSADSCVIKQSSGGPTPNTVSAAGSVHGIVLEGVDIESSAESAFNISSKTAVYLALSGNNTLKSGADEAGIQMLLGASVAITGTASDSLNVSGSGFGAGIGFGVGYKTSGNSVTISGGTVTAAGGNKGVGIGDNNSGKDCTVAIAGGAVKADGGSGGAGISGAVTIAGGTVAANGGSGGAGIGGTVTIIGGTVTANSVNAPTNGSVPVYPTTVSVPKGTAVSALSVKRGGGGYSYGYKDMRADAASFGKLYLWLPADTGSAETTADAAMTDGGVYTGYHGAVSSGATISSPSVLKMSQDLTVSSNNLIYGQPYTVTFAGGNDSAVGTVTYSGHDDATDTELPASDAAQPTDAGTYTASGAKAGNDAYYPGNNSVKYTIAQKSLTSADISVSDICDQPYKNGSAVEPGITVKDGNTPLTEKKDYSVVYQNNKNVGMATATVTGIGNYQGDVDRIFAIGMVTLFDIGNGNITVSNGTADGYDRTGKHITATVSTACIITGTTSQYTVSIIDGTQNSITLDGAHITSAGGCAFSIDPGASLCLTLVGTNTLQSGGNFAGLRVPEKAALTIACDSTGSLAATGHSGAGIGGNNDEACGAVTIDSGTVSAESNFGGAGIGGGYGGYTGGAGGTITIDGGTVSAKSIDGGAGIGGGSGGTGGAGGTITIKGGTVSAKSVVDSSYAGGSAIGDDIGGGWGCNNGTVTGTGCTVTLNGGTIKADKVRQPKNGVVPVYPTTVSVPKGTDVNALTVKQSGSSTPYHYGYNDMRADAAAYGKLYLWLPANTDVSAVTTADVTTDGGAYKGYHGAVSSGATTGSPSVLKMDQSLTVGNNNNLIYGLPYTVMYTSGGACTAGSVTYSGHDDATNSNLPANDTVQPTDAGTYTATTSQQKAGDDAYNPGSTSVNYAIAQKSLASKDISVSDIPDQTYSGSKIEPEAVVKDGNIELKKSKDYSIAYKDNTDQGTATATITGINNYKDDVTKHFTISRGVLLDIGNGSITISNGTADGYDSGKNHVTAPIAGGCTITGATETNTVTVSDGKADVTFYGVTINLKTGCAFSVAAGASVNLTLAGTNTLQSGSGYAGLQLPDKAALTVTPDGSGSLAAKGGDYGAGIGGGDHGVGGTVIISGGAVKADGGYCGAGIGGGSAGKGGSVTINGGAVTAKGNAYCAGIGGGRDSTGGKVTISGGTVEATGGSGGSGSGAGIGSGGCSADSSVKVNGGIITISGGKTTATGVAGSAGIGGGTNSGGGTVKISGGTVGATGGVGGGAGIGGGIYGDGGTVTVTGTGTSVTAKGQDGGRDIGSGYARDSGGQLTVGEAAMALTPLPAVTLDSKGTDAQTTFKNCVIQGSGAGALAGTYYTVIFDKNGGDTAPSPADSTAKSGGTVLLPTTGPTRAGYIFSGWKTKDGADFTANTPMTAGITVYAQWKKDDNYHPIAYHLDGGANDAQNPNSYTCGTGAAITLNPPKKDGFTFGGWYADSGFSGPAVTKIDDAFAAKYAVGATIDLYARWLVPTVTDIVVNPSAATVSTGSTQAFTAAVQGNNNPPQSVTWKVGGNKSANTKIDGSGILTVGSDEAAAALTVTATSTADSTKSGTATVTVTKAAPAKPAIIIAESPFKSLLHFVTFGLFFGETIDVSFSSPDSSNIDHYEYQTVAYGGTAGGAWTAGGSFSISPDFKGMVYAKAVSKNGVVSDATVEALVVDKTKPEITVTYSTPDDKIYVKVSDSGAGIGTITYKVGSEAAQTYNLEPTETKDITTLNNFEIDNLPDGIYDVVIDAVDNSGNAADTKTAINKQGSITVTGVTVSPQTATVAVGFTQAFSAAVQGSNNPPQNVTWKIGGNKSANTTINKSGVLTVGSDETAAALTVTATSAFDTGKSGTATVTVTKTPPPAPIVTGVTVSPQTATVSAGSTQTFTAAVQGSNNPPQGVTWKVGGNKSANTTINKSGVLTVGSDETAATLTVTATSVFDTGKSGTVTVTVTKTPPPAPPITPPAAPVMPIIPPVPQGTGLGRTFLSDTTAPLSVDDCYTFKITSKDGKVPSFIVGTAGVFDVTLVKQEGSDYYFRLTAIGVPGSSAGIYVDGGTRLLIATVERNSNYAACDTTCPINVESGKSYIFKITARKKPDFEAGTPGVFRLEFLYQDGDNYYYRITAIGRPGQGCGFYLNGSQQPVAAATIR